MTWNLHNWFYSASNPIYFPCSKVNEDRVHIDEHGAKYINFFPELLHGRKERKKLTDFPEHVQEGVKKIWNHIYIDWCSRKEYQFKYVQLFLSNVVKRKKMTACLNLKSQKGIGKSIIIDFLTKSVLGTQLVYQTADSNILSGRFNAVLMNLLLFVLEEAPCQTLGEWKVLDSKLKNFITEHEISIEKKGKDHFKIENTVSFIIFSNKNSIAYTDDERRYFSPDISSELKGNKKYFVELAKITKDREVGEAFYWNCIDIAEKISNWHEQFDMPISEENKRNIADNAPSIVQFIKNMYVLKKINIDLKLSEFYNKYKTYCESNKIQYVLKKGDFVSKLKELGINYIHQSTAHHNNNWISEKHENLLKIFKLKNLILDIDDFETHAPTPDPEKIEMLNDVDVIGINEDDDIKNDIEISKEINKIAFL